MRAGEWLNDFLWPELGESIQASLKLMVIKGDIDFSNGQQLLCSGHLMIVARFSEGPSARHHENGFTTLKRGQDGAHAGMGDYETGIC